MHGKPDTTRVYIYVNLYVTDITVYTVLQLRFDENLFSHEFTYENMPLSPITNAMDSVVIFIKKKRE